jgi:hypothetical protein
VPEADGADGPESADWVGDPAIAWRILLTAELDRPLDDATDRLAALHVEQRWPGTGTVHRAPDVGELQRRLGDEREGVVSVGLVPDGRHVVVAAHHSHVDGLGLLAVLAALTGGTVASTARGVGDRPDAAGRAGTVVRRLAEVATAPPARVVVPRRDAETADVGPGDVHAGQAVPGEVRTAALVVAATRAIVAHNSAHGAGRRTRHVAVAVGVARSGTSAAGGAGGPIADRSALIRLRDVEHLDVDAVADALRHAPTERAPHTAGGGAAVLRAGLRLLAPRLGSTILVSHLGRVRADGVTGLVFHPVTAGGSGLSLGAVTLDGASPVTTLSLRARGSQWTHDGLEQLLEAVVAGLDRAQG